MSAAIPNPIPSTLAEYPTHPLLSKPHLLTAVNLAILAFFPARPTSLTGITSPLFYALLAAYTLLVVWTDPLGVVVGSKADRKAGVEGEKGVNEVGLVGRIGVGLTTGGVVWVASGWVMDQI